MQVTYKVLFYLYITVLAVISLAFILWPLPAFMMDQISSEAYFDFILGQTGSTDKSRFAVIPYAWAFMSLPLGVALTPVGIAFWFLVELIIRTSIRFYKFVTHE